MAKKKGRKKARPKIIPMLIDGSGALHAGLQALGPAQAGDMEGAGKAFVGQLTANYGGYNVITGEPDIMALAIGYGPPLIRRMIARLGFRMKWLF